MFPLLCSVTVTNFEGQNQSQSGTQGQEESQREASDDEEDIPLAQLT